ncbi:MAG TPA: helicase-associated domain-containing protein [Myxococcota bacterium]|nr:helicase-associated domain-containing protein [Myxococcota bacterium]
MVYVPDNPLIAQSDHTILLETGSPRFEEARDALLAFAELVKSPEYVHTWRITSLSLWNAAAAGHTADEIIEALRRYAKYPVPENLPASIRERMARYGRLRLVRDGEWLRIEADDPVDLAEVRGLPDLDDLVADDRGGLRVSPRRRGELKRLLLASGHPVEDLAGFDDGDELTMALSTVTPAGRPWSMRDYQIEAVDAFFAGPGGGSGVVVLPCGAGKTMVGIGAMVRLGMRTLILCTGNTALQQWKREVLERTTLTEEQVGEFTADVKRLAPVTLTTYQLLTWRPGKHAPPAHFRLFWEARWGLVIYDEVHLLPAPIFRESAWLQARRRLGLTATLVREDGLEGDVFALVGPKRFDLPWKHLEQHGWIATARCVEVRVALSTEDRLRMIAAPARQKSDIAARNARKGAVLERLLARHADEQILVLGTWLDHLEFLARRFGIPLISGDTPAAERRALLERFRSGELRVLALSKVGNFSVDLPGASVAIQVSGTFGSRQEEAQRLGRVLRPKEGRNQATFYSLVTADSPEQQFSERRQLFLTEQGYPYRVEEAG